jgi:hypothetical protein
MAKVIFNFLDFEAGIIYEKTQINDLSISYQFLSKNLLIM